MNPLTQELTTGTVGELLLQLRLLQHGVQAAPPLKDTGNDLIAIRGNVFKAVQVKTTTADRVRPEVPDRAFHLLGLVRLEGEGNTLHLDKCTIYLIPKDDVARLGDGGPRLEDYRLTDGLVEQLFRF
jgi:hypothetical protein